MDERERTIDAFLSNNGWAVTARSPLADDASFRRYERLVDGNRRAVLMDAPPPHEDVRPFTAMARHLMALGLSAPNILAEDTASGLLILEDLGDATYTQVLTTTPAREHDLYALAVDVLAHIHATPSGQVLPDGLPPYDTARLIEEALLLTDWYMPAVLGTETESSARDAYIQAWREALDRLNATAPTLVLRDFHVDNLMALDEREGLAACGLLDFQDAVAGHPAYDLMSLLEDARRDIEPSMIAAMKERYFLAMPDLRQDGVARQQFKTAFAVLAAQRHAKVIGIFTRLHRRDGKPAYLGHIPRVWRLLEASLADPALSAVGHWFDRHLPTHTRRPPEAAP